MLCVSCCDGGDLWYAAHTHPLMAICPGPPRWACTRKVKPMWILLKQETVSGSGISWTICKSAPRTAWAISPHQCTACRWCQSNSSMHHYECITLCKDVSLQRGRFCSRSLTSCIPRFSEDRSSWMFFVQVVRGRPGGRLQFSAFSSIRARCPEKARRWDLMVDESGGWLQADKFSVHINSMCISLISAVDIIFYRVMLVCLHLRSCSPCCIPTSSKMSMCQM